MLRHFIIGIALTLLGALLTACVSSGSHYTSTVESWRGGNVKTLINRWGKPDQRVSNLNGHMLYIYKVRSNTFHSVNSAYSPAGNTTPISSAHHQALNCLAVFEVTRKGQIVDAQARGNNCYASNLFTSSMRNPQ